MSGAYYNEFDPKAAACLRELIRGGHIAPGDVDERSIEDITPYEIAKYTQCHFFAGIGVWSYALRLAKWPDTRCVWTGSCPCQPFSQAGKGAGTSDERHLWPAWGHLIRELDPPAIFGEQVASKAADLWADLVQDDLEALGYAFGAVPFPAASVGAPHIRDRLYWMAHHHQGARRGQERPHGGGVLVGDRAQGFAARLESSGGNQRLADDDDDARRQQHAQRHGEPQARLEARQPGGDAGGRGELGNPGGGGSGRNTGEVPGEEGGAERRVRRFSDLTGFAGSDGELGHMQQQQGLERYARNGDSASGRAIPSRPTAPAGAASFWDAHELLWCRDGKWRPVEPGTFPLAHGAPARVGRLRGYGNAIVAQAAKVFIEASGLV